MRIVSRFEQLALHSRLHCNEEITRSDPATKEIPSHMYITHQYMQESECSNQKSTSTQLSQSVIQYYMNIKVQNIDYKV